MNVAMTFYFKSTKDAGFYLDFASNIDTTYDFLLIIIYSEVLFSPIRITDNSKLRVFGKNTVSLTVIIDDKAFQVNFFKVFHFFDLESNFFSVSKIEEAGYQVLNKNEKMSVFDNEDNFALVKTQIKTGYLVDISCNETYYDLFFYHSPTKNLAF